MPTIWEWPRAHRGTTDSQFQLQARNLGSQSPWTGESAYEGPNVQRFIAKLTFPRKTWPNWRELSGIITRSRGTKGLWRLVDYHRMFSAWDTRARKDATTRNFSDDRTWSDGRGWADGFLPPFVTLAEPAPAGARSVVLQGLPASQDAVLTLGDLFEHRPNGIPLPHGAMGEMTQQVRTDSNGKTRIEFEPGLRVAGFAGDMIVLRYPTSVFRFASDTEGAIQRSLGNLGSLGISCIEVLPEEIVE